MDSAPIVRSAATGRHGSFGSRVSVAVPYSSRGSRDRAVGWNLGIMTTKISLTLVCLLLLPAVAQERGRMLLERCATVVQTVNVVYQDAFSASGSDRASGAETHGPPVW